MWPSTANKAEVGKTTLPKVLAAIVKGYAPATISYSSDESEFEKQLATRVDAGDHVIVVDNAKLRKPIESQVLERCITDSRPSFRRLGSNTSITRAQTCAGWESTCGHGGGVGVSGMVFS